MAPSLWILRKAFEIDERIEGPLHVADAARKRLTSLFPFELLAKAAIAMGSPDRQHVRVEIGLRPVLSLPDSRQRHGEANEVLRRFGAGFAVKSADDLAANFLSKHEGLARSDVAFVVSPGLNLELNAVLHLVESIATANLNHFCGPVCALGRARVSSCGGPFCARSFCVRSSCIPPVRLSAAPSASFFFACTQSASSSGGERSSSGRGAARSISLKRRRKRRLQLRNAISASTPRCRPRLTTVNSRSPSSASTSRLAGRLI